MRISLKSLLLFFILAVIIRLFVYILVILPDIRTSLYFPFLFPDSQDFIAYAANLNLKGEYINAVNFHAWRMPAYSYILSFIYSPDFASGYMISLRLPNLIFAGINSALAYSLAFTLRGRLAGIFAGLIMALYPFMVYIDSLVLADTLAVTLVLACVYAGVLLVQSRSAPERIYKYSFILGALLAGAAYVKASLGLLVIIFCLYIFIALYNVFRLRSLKFIAVILIAYLAFMSPWWQRNYKQFATFIPFSTMGGFTFWEATGPGADGGANHGKVGFPDDWQKVVSGISSNGDGDSYNGIHPEVYADKLIFSQTIEVVKNDWPRFFELSLNKIKRTWNPFLNWEGAGWLKSAVLCLSYLPVMILGVWAAWRLRRDWRGLYIFLLPLLYLFVVHAFFMGSVRYRMPAVACMIVLAGIGAAEIFKIIKAKAE